METHAQLPVALPEPEDGAPATSQSGARRGVASIEVPCRALDIVVSFFTLVVLSPLMAIIALAIKLDSRGPVLFNQRRVGLDLETFVVHKFRTMHHGADHGVHREYYLELIANAVPGRKLERDTRVTRVGRFLRRTSLDELPQLWNVLRGQMSLVGPRPPIPYEVEKYPPHWFARFGVKPGITGLWQVSGRSTVSIEEMIHLDIEYARTRSLATNLWIILRTIPAVLSLRGAS